MNKVSRPYEWYRNMYGLAAVILCGILVGAILIGGKSAKSVVSKIVPTPTIGPTNTPTSSINPKKTPSNFPTQTKKNMTKPTPTSKIQPDNTLSFQYPGSTKVSGSLYTTTDSPQTVTDWYKDKIRTSGMQTTAFVQNSVNGTVNNILMGSNNSREVRIVIKKSEGSAKTEIVVTE